MEKENACVAGYGAARSGPTLISQLQLIKLLIISLMTIQKSWKVFFSRWVRDCPYTRTIQTNA